MYDCNQSENMTSKTETDDTFENGRYGVHRNGVSLRIKNSDMIKKPYKLIIQISWTRKSTDEGKLIRSD